MSDKYVNIKVKKETRDFLKTIADMINDSCSSNNKATVAGLVTMFAEKYRRSLISSEIQGSAKEWIELGMPTLVSFTHKKNKASSNESK